MSTIPCEAIQADYDWDMGQETQKEPYDTPQVTVLGTTSDITFETSVEIYM